MWKIWLTIFGAALIGCLASFGANAQAPADELIVTTLGTGSPPPVLDRFGPATLIRAGSETILIDAGRGAAQRVWQAKVRIGSLSGLFLTHLHSDHTVGLPDLWLIGWLPSPYGGRKTPLRLWGPAGTQAMAAGLTQAYAWDIKARTADQHLPPQGVAIDAVDIREGVVYEHGGVKVTAFEVDHGELLRPAFGYRIDYGGRSVVLSGDTRLSENLIGHAKDVDLLIHEVAMAKDELVRKSEAVRLILAHHPTPEDVGTVFTRTKPKLAALHHMVRLNDAEIGPPSDADIAERTRATYSGRLVIAQDMMTFVITKAGVKVVPPTP